MSRWFQVFGPCPDCRRLRAALAAERAAREKAEAERDRLREATTKLAEALDDLMAWQNGPPLPTYEKGWTAAMAVADVALDEARALCADTRTPTPEAKQ
jgi:hypothetical protein